MIKTKSSRKALLQSVISLLLCFTMLIGSTFAWFTDIVTSSNNIIVAGNLDIELEYLNAAGEWKPVKADTNVFSEGTYWEPGHTEVAYLRISNLGSLALKYQLGVSVANETGSVNAAGEDFKLSDYIQFAAIEGVQTPYADRAAARAAVKSAAALSTAYTQRGTIEAGGASQYVALVVFMPESVGNEANHTAGANIPQIQLGITLTATQHSSESDSFGSDYDADAKLPDFVGKYSISAPAPTRDANNQTTDATSIADSHSDVSAEVPVGVKMEAGADKLTLEIEKTDRSSNIEMNGGEVSRSLDVHIDGIAADNTVPVIVNLGAVLPAGLKDSSINLYHVENGVPVKMTGVTAFTEHNQYIYNSATGEVSIYIKSFSEFTAVVAINNPWNGEIDTAWYNTTDTSFTIGTAEELAGFGAIVGGMAEGIERDTFAGKTVTLTADLDLGGLGGRVWYPIGYQNSYGGYTRVAGVEVSSTVYTFAGIFDGGNHTISNIYQNTWEMFGDYNNGYTGTPNYYKDGMGLFGYVNGGTVRNLNVNNFQSDGEFTPTGCVTAYACKASFENISVFNSNPRVYNTGNGGIVGIAGDDSDPDTYEISFTNINVNSTNKISALWGSWDVGCGGVIGMYRGNGKINMTDCEIGAIIDANNDVCGNYQYYQYRYAGMLIGTAGKNRTPSDAGFNFNNVKVYIGNWADYYYCEFEKNSQGSYTDDFQFSRVDKSEININPETNLPDFSHSPCRHVHTANEDKMGLYLPFSQLYTGYSWGASPVFSHEGVEVIRYFYMVTYMDAESSQVLHVDYVTAGERSDSKLWADAYTVKTDCITNKDGKIFKGWVNADSTITNSISAGNRNDVVLYESWDNPYIIRFVDRDGNVIYSEAFTDDHKTLTYVPDVPEVEGYYGMWEPYESRLNNVTSDVTIHPIYTIEQVETGDIIAPGSMTAAQLFAKLEAGNNLVMSEDLEDDGSSLKGGKNNLCVIDGGVTSRLNLNNSELTCNFAHNANKEWSIFNISDGATLTIAGGVNGEGSLRLNLNNMNSNANACAFNLESGGTLVLEAGVNIEIYYPTQFEGKVTAFKVNGVELNADDYPGFYVEKDTENGIIHIIVGVTTTITG